MVLDCEYAIIGGGIAGLTLGHSFEKRNKNYLIFEQAPVLKGIGAGFGLAANAMQALEFLGIREEVEKIGFYTDSFEILDHHGRVLLHPDTKRLSSQYQQKNFTVHRADLHMCLLSKIPTDRLRTNKKLIRFDKLTTHVQVLFEDGTSFSCQYLIVADGVRSKGRQQLIPASKPRYSGYTCWRGTLSNKEIKLKVGSETWGPKGRFGMTPLVGDRIYWYACINSTPNNKKLGSFNINDLLNNFSTYHDPIPQIVESTLDRDLIWGDIIDIKPISAFAHGPILLIGDAAHATTPNMGQGACQALEDVAVLTDELIKTTDVLLAFKRFEKRRLQRTKYITQTSLKIGWAAQFTNPLMILLRNNLMRILPNSWTQRSLHNLLSKDFMTL